MPPMAIAFARARYISRSTGGSAIRSAAYNAREAILDERTGEHFSFKHRDAPDHHEVLLPEGADSRLSDATTLWNVAEAAEKRRDAQVARELVIALPANRELSDEDRLELVRSFAQEHFVKRGLAVQLDVHAPHEGEEDSEKANWHAHLLVTTRRVAGDRLSAKKARDLDPEVRHFGARAAVTDGEAWGALWRDHQDRYFIEHGLSLRVDAMSAVPGQHVGPVRMRAPDSAAVARAEAIARENAQAARDPDKVLVVLTRNNATFTERELDRHLGKHIQDEAEHLGVKAAVLAAKDIVALYDPDTGVPIGRYTTRQVRGQERAAIADAGEIALARRHRAVGERARNASSAERSLRPDQQAAFDYATASGGLKIVEGRAGTGKSYTLGAIREAHERGGYSVLGLAPTNSVAQDLKADGFDQAATVHSELFRLKNGRTAWGSQTLVVVDEAAMLDSRVTGELLVEVKRAGAKLILAGDDRQLASIERGGLFAELRLRHGSAEITEVTRQKVDWQRQAARDLAEGRMVPAVEAFDRAGAISWSDSQSDALQKLVERWTKDTATAADDTRFVFAYTNKDVDTLNAALRHVRHDRGELGEGAEFATKHGVAQFAVGDRVQFTDTLRAAKIYNGNAGVITAIDAQSGVLHAVLDGAGGQGRQVSWSAETFDGFRHGYAGTIYKGQGKTLDHSYLYHSHHWRQSSSYVALTRQRESAQIFVARETAKDVEQLARQMGRQEVRSASVAWATREELRASLRPVVERTAMPEGRGEAPLLVQRSATRARGSTEAQNWWIAPQAPTAPVTLDQIMAVVSADADVGREREALGRYLEGAFRDPQAARTRLDALIGTHGATSASVRLAADPSQLGDMRGRAGVFVGASARQARIQAERVAGAIGPAVSRLAEAERAAAKRFTTDSDDKRQAISIGVPRLSPAAQTAIERIARAKDDPTQVEAWKAVRADRQIAGEIDGFMTAVEQRFGAQGMRALDRTGRFADMKVDADEQVTIGEIGRVVQTVRGAERNSTAVSQRQVASERIGQGARLKP